LAGALFAGCQAAPISSSAVGNDVPGGEEKKQEVSFWTLTSYQNAADAVLAEWEKAHPNIKINVTLNGGDPHKNNLMVAAASNTLPDIWFNWGGTLATFYSDNGLTYDLSAYAKEHKWEDRFIPDTLSLATFDHQIVGFPVNFNILEMFYRKDLFEKVGAKAPNYLCGARIGHGQA
jgi:raffinose/stachyose/melibiose transport system substrate-binding protein